MAIIGDTTKIGFGGQTSATILPVPDANDHYLIYNIISPADDDDVIITATHGVDNPVDMLKMPGATNNTGSILNCSKPIDWPVGRGVGCSHSSGASVVYQLIKG